MLRSIVRVNFIVTDIYITGGLLQHNLDMGRYLSFATVILQLCHFQQRSNLLTRNIQLLTNVKEGPYSVSQIRYVNVTFL